MRASHLTLGAPPVGLVLGAAAWLVFSHGASATQKIGELRSEVEALRATAPPTTSAANGLLAAASPIFALTTGPGAVPDIPVQLFGVAKTPDHSSALMAINNKPAGWLELGETRDDITLDEVQADKIVVDTPTGSKEVTLGAKPAASAPSPSPTTSSMTSPAPSGYRLPPPPASAPQR